MARIGRLSLLLAVFAAHLAQAEVNVIATVDRNQMSLGDTFTYTIRVTSDSSVPVESPNLPSFDSLDLLNQWSSMEARAQYVTTENGQEFKTVRTQSFSYMLQPKRVGNIRIGASEVVVDGKTHQTQPIELKIFNGPVPGQPAPKPGNGEPEEEDDDPFSQMLRMPTPFGFPGMRQRGAPGNPNDAFAIQVVVDKNKVYQNEQVTVSWYLLTTGLIRDLDTLKYPDLKGFWKEDIEIATNLNFRQEVINGIVYKKALLASAALFPRRPGAAIIDPYRAKATVITGGAFGSFGIGQPYTLTKASSEVKIEVLPLPEESRPKDFSGAVGQFNISANVGNSSVPVNQPVELKVRIEGRGNAKLIDLPPLNLPKEIELYDQKADAKFFPNGSSYKDFTILLIPRAPGKVTLPAISASIFDTQLKRFVQKTTQPLELNVTPADGAGPIPSVSQLPTAPKPSVKWAPELDARFLLPVWPSDSDWLWIWLAVYSAVAIALLLRARNAFGWGQKKLTLTQQVKRRFKAIHALADKGQWRQAGAEATNTVYYLLAEMAGRSGANVPISKLWREMPPSLRAELEEPVSRVLAQFEILSFAPDEMGQEFKEKTKLRERVRELEALMRKAVDLSGLEKSHKDRSRMSVWVLVALTLSLGSQLYAVPRISPLVLEAQKMPAPQRWMFDSKAKRPLMSSQAGSLAQMRISQDQQDFAACLRFAKKSVTGASVVAPWVARSALTCAMAGFKDNKLKADALREWLRVVESHPTWWWGGAHSSQLRRNIWRASLMLIESQLKSNRTQAWAEIEKLSRFEHELPIEERAELNRLSGEVQFIEQNLNAAQGYFERSLALKPSPLVRNRLNAFSNSMGRAKPGNGEKVVVPGIESSSEEEELTQRLRDAFRSGDLLSAFEDTVKLARSYPGSVHKSWAVDRMLESYFNVLGRTDKRFLTIEDRLQGLMLRLDSQTQFEWAKKLLARGFYAPALKLSERAMVGFDGMAESTAVIFLAARAALFTDQTKLAERYLRTLVDQHAGTTEATEALFRLGLVHMHKQEYSQAAAVFERLLALPKADNWELSARYWLWQSLKLQKSPRAAEASRVLIDKFPFSYYGLRAQADGSGEIAMEWHPKKATASFWLSGSQHQTLKRIDLLLESGWWEEAQLELQTLPAPLSAANKAIMAQYYARAMDFSRSTALINEAWDEDPTFRNPPFLQTAFPDEFNKVITREAQALRMSPLLVRSLIKQESAFNLRAVSSSGALGLMQMIPPTAQEVADQLGMRNLKIPEDLFQFETNIHMGSTYLAGLLDRYQHNVPMALAAYNAGPSRLERWLEARPSLAGLALKRSSDPFNELWIEELPWSETRQYVKAILRNTLLYELLEKGRVTITEPVWRQLVVDRLKSTQ